MMNKKQDNDNRHRQIKKHELVAFVTVFVTGILIGSLVIAGPRVQPQCNDGIDNDGDTRTDYPNDPGCTNKRDKSERGTAHCDDGIDNDGDTRTDYPNDPGCSSPSDTSESGTYQCDDGIDNGDADTLRDYPSDAGCVSLTDNNEVDGPCDDTFDNDADGFRDYPNDPECTSFASKEGNCVDTDGGFVYGLQGTVSGSTGGIPYSHTDICLDSATLRENFCDVGIGQPGSLNQNCGTNSTNATGCVNGACS